MNISRLNQTWGISNLLDWIRRPSKIGRRLTSCDSVLPKLSNFHLCNKVLFLLKFFHICSYSPKALSKWNSGENCYEAVNLVRRVYINCVGTGEDFGRIPIPLQRSNLEHNHPFRGKIGQCHQFNFSVICIPLARMWTFPYCLLRYWLTFRPS